MLAHEIPTSAILIPRASIHWVKIWQSHGMSSLMVQHQVRRRRAWTKGGDTNTVSIANGDWHSISGRCRDFPCALCWDDIKHVNLPKVRFAAHSFNSITDVNTMSLCGKPTSHAIFSCGIWHGVEIE